MILAILEILALLTVSCLIGIFFTYRFWKAKHQILQVENDKLNKEVNTLLEKLKTAQSKTNQLETALTQSQNKLTIAEESLKEKASKKQVETNTDEAESKKFKKAIALLKEEMGEKERELQDVSEELELRKISYYRHIDGNRYKAATLNMADEAIAGQGDGRISMADAVLIFDTISNGTDYTQVEKHTIKYLRDNYNWTDEADELFRTKVRSWAAMDHELI
ncbi:MAG: alanyl-tRNA synthetase [Cyclobacteriaceae bacterium]|jgi:alanyl-tRNA synthetase